MITGGKIWAIGVGLFGPLILTSCKTTEVVVETFTRVESAHQVFSGQLFGAGEEGFESGLQIITSNIAWEQMVTKTKRQKEIFEAIGATTFDFDNEMVIAYFDQVRPTNGYVLTADSVLQSASKIKVFFSLTKPSGPAGEVLTQPYSLMATPKTSKPVAYVLTEQ